MNPLKRNAARRRRLALPTLVIAVIGAVSVAGCGASKQEQFGDKKEDWVKTKPPPQYHGPGQPGGPPAGALNGPATPPPTSRTGGS